MSAVNNSIYNYPCHDELDNIKVEIVDDEIHVNLTYINVRDYANFDADENDEVIIIPRVDRCLVIDHNDYLNGDVTDQQILNIMDKNRISTGEINLDADYDTDIYCDDDYKMVTTIRTFIDDACEDYDIYRSSSTTKSARKI